MYIRLDHLGVFIWLGGMLLGTFAAERGVSWWWMGLAGVLILGGGALVVRYERRKPQLGPFGRPWRKEDRMDG